MTILVVLAALTTACSGDGSSGESDDGTTAPAAGSDAEITIADFSFSGATSVSVGDTVEVTNNDTVGHTWTASDGTFDSGTLAEGASFDFTFDEAGEYDFMCSIHPQMTGTITVEG
jgi:plastocyanin